MNRIDKIHEEVKKYTIKLINEYKIDDNGIDALGVSLDLGLDRANVSKDLNNLWKKGLIIKIQNRPILFLDREELLKAYSIGYLPNLIAKGEKISNFLLTDNQLKPKENKIIDSIDNIIGAKDTLSLQIKKAKAAISYPPIGLHTLIMGSAGVGKWKFANQMFNYGVNHGRKKSTSKFIRVDCQYFSDSSSNFNIALCGAAKGASNTSVDKYRKGMIEECNSGVLYLDNIHKLHADFLDMIVELIEKNTYYRVGESIPREFDCTIIASSTLEPNNIKLDYISKYLPCKISIPNIDDRNLNEKIEQILYFFSLEAIQTKYPIRLHKDILTLFILKQYQENLTELRNEVRQVCAKAFLDTCNSSINILAIGFQHLSIEMLSLKNDSTLRLTIARILSAIDKDYILIDENGNSSTIEYFKNISKESGLARINNFISEFNTDIEEVDNIQDYVSENINILNNCATTQLEALRNIINPLVYQIFQKSITDKTTLDNYNQHSHLFYGVLLHVSNLIKRIENNLYVINQENAKSNTIHIYPDEYHDALLIIRSIEDYFDCKLSPKEIDFIALYFAITNQWSSKIKPNVIVASHGENIATDMVSFIKNEMATKVEIIGINYKNGMQFNDFLEIVSVNAHTIDNSAGILLITDFEPLLSISDYLRINENVKSRTIAPLSLQTIKEAITKIEEGYSLDQIIQAHDKKQEIKNVYNAPKSNFIDQLTNNFIASTTTFIDPYKSVTHLLESLDIICTKLSIPITDSLSVKFLCHSIHMLERVIRKEPLQYPKLKPFTNENQKLFHIIDKSFMEIEEIYGIKIASDEIAYITEIFMN